MLLPDCLDAIIDQFDGANTLLEPYSVPIESGFYSQNVSFVRGEVGTRLGHSLVATAAENRIETLTNWLLYYNGSIAAMVLYFATGVGIKSYSQTANVYGIGFTTTLVPFTGNAASASIVTNGGQFFVAFHGGPFQPGVAGGQIFSFAGSNDPLFAAPLVNVPAVAEGGALSGSVTAGPHRIGFLPTTRTGFATLLSPGSFFSSPTWTFVPSTLTASGDRNFTISIPTAPSVPTYMVGGTYQAVMTTATNLNRYYAVPGTITAVNPSGATSMTVSISDDDLAATGTDVTELLNGLVCTTQVSPFTPPFLPSAIFTYSNRMGYVTVDAAGFPVVYMSDQNNPQRITADQHCLYIEGRRRPVQGFSLLGTCYIATTDAFYSTEDSGNVPVQWTPPKKVDGSIGILYPGCIPANHAIGYIPVASEHGLYIFKGGVFPELPISYYQSSDWSRIDWPQADVEVVDDQLNRKIIVLAPLAASNGLATGTSAAGIYLMTWDYTDGFEPENARYSINAIQGFALGAMGVILNATTFLQEVWYGCRSGGLSGAPIIRQNNGAEATPYRDPDNNGAAAAINSLYETSLIPGSQDPNSLTATVHDYHGMHMRVRGVGLLSMLINGLDRVRSIVPPRSPLLLSQASGKEELVKFFLRSERASVQFGTNAIDQHFVMNLLRVYYTNAMSQR